MYKRDSGAAQGAARGPTCAHPVQIVASRRGDSGVGKARTKQEPSQKSLRSGSHGSGSHGQIRYIQGKGGSAGCLLETPRGPCTRPSRLCRRRRRRRVTLSAPRLDWGRVWRVALFAVSRGVFVLARDVVARSAEHAVLLPSDPARIAQPLRVGTVPPHRRPA